MFWWGCRVSDKLRKAHRRWGRWRRCWEGGRPAKKVPGRSGVVVLRKAGDGCVMGAPSQKTMPAPRASALSAGGAALPEGIARFSGAGAAPARRLGIRTDDGGSPPNAVGRR